MYLRVEMEHLSLSSQWLILAAFWWYFRSTKEVNYFKNSIVWVALIGMAGLIHPYLAIFTLAIALASIVKDWRINKILTTKQSVELIATIVSILLIEWWLTGYFYYIGEEFEVSGFEKYSTNLNSLINSMGTSRWLAGLPTYGCCQYEGYAYLGLGVIILAIGAIILHTYSIIKKPSLINRKIIRDHSPLLIVCLVLFIYSISNWISWADRLLFSYNIEGDLLVKITQNLFRGSGRFIWPIYYLIFLIVIWSFIRIMPTKYVVPILFIGIVFQVSDLDIRKQLSNNQNYQGNLVDPNWSEIVNPFEIIVPIHPYTRSIAQAWDFKDFANLAANNGKQVATGYVTRLPIKSIEKESKQIERQLRSRQPNPKSLYVFSEDTLYLYWEDIKDSTRCHLLDGYFACYSRNHFPSLLNNESNFEQINILQYFEKYHNKLIILVAEDEASQALSDEFINYLSTRGSNISQLGFRDSYALILYKDHPVFEKISKASPIIKDWTKGSQIEYSEGALSFLESISIYSAGYDLGNDSYILLNGDSNTKNKRGLNIIVLDDNFEIISTAHFDTYKTDNAIIPK